MIACLAIALLCWSPAQTTGSIRGIVVDTKEGTGIRRVSVRLQSTGRTVVTGDDGRFEIAEVPIGDQELYISAVDFILVKRTVTVAAGAVTDVFIVLAEGTGTYTARAYQSLEFIGGFALADSRAARIVYSRESSLPVQPFLPFRPLLPR